MADKNSYLESAQRFLQKNQLDRAIKDYYRALELDPKDVRVRHKLGELLARFGSRAEALKELGLVAESYAKDKFYLRAVAVYKQMVRLKDDLYDVHLRLGDLYRLASLNSDAMEHYKLVAEYYEVHGTSKECIEVFKKICELLPDDLLARQKLAEYYVREERIDEAVTLYKGVARSFQEKKQPDELLRIFDRLVQLEPAELSHYRQAAKVALEVREPRRALSRLQVCFKADPSDTETLALLGETFVNLEQFPKALQVYKELARLYDFQGSSDKVKDVYQRIRRFAPDDPESCQALGIKVSEAPSAGHARASATMPELVVETSRPIGTVPVGAGSASVPVGASPVAAEPPLSIPASSGPRGTSAATTAAVITATSATMSGQNPPLSQSAGAASPSSSGVRTTSPGAARSDFSPTGYSQGFAGVRSTGSGASGVPTPTREPLMGRPVAPAGTLGRLAPVRSDASSSGAGASFVTPVERPVEPTRSPGVRTTGPTGAAALRAIPPSVSKLMTECEVYLKYQLTEKALAHLATILEKEPACYLALEKRRDLLQGVGRKADAAIECERMARLARDAGDLTLARHDLEVGLSLVPGHAGCLALLEELKRPASTGASSLSTPIFTASTGQVLIEVEDEEEEDDAEEDEELASIALSDMAAMGSEDSDTFELVDDGPSGALPFSMELAAPLPPVPVKAVERTSAPATGKGLVAPMPDVRAQGGQTPALPVSSKPVHTENRDEDAIEDMLDELVDDGSSFPSVYLSLGDDVFGEGGGAVVSPAASAPAAARVARPEGVSHAAPARDASLRSEAARVPAAAAPIISVGRSDAGRSAASAGAVGPALALGSTRTQEPLDQELSFEQRVSMHAPGGSGALSGGSARTKAAVGEAAGQTGTAASFAGARSASAQAASKAAPGLTAPAPAASTPAPSKPSASQGIRGGRPLDPLAGSAAGAGAEARGGESKVAPKLTGASIRGGLPQGAAAPLAALALPPRSSGASSAVHLNSAGTPATETGLRAPVRGAVPSSPLAPKAREPEEMFELFGDEPSVPEDTMDGLDLVAELERELSFTSAEFRNPQQNQRSSRSVERSLDVARAYMQMGLMDEALKELERCRQQGPLGVEATRLMGQCHFKRGNLGDAVHWFQAVLNRNDLTETQELEALFELAMVYEAQQDRARALDLLEEISSLNEHFRPAEVAARRQALGGEQSSPGAAPGPSRSGASAPLR